jgi:mycothiol S-conjugate amidase
MDRPEIRADLAAVRRQELDTAAAIIGYDEVVLLGYRDSGMPDSPENGHPEAFANADFDEAVGRLVAVIRREQPQVIITYADNQQGYPHPDHLRVHDISVAAFDRAGDPDAYPDSGEPFQPLKLYYSVWSKRRLEAVHRRFDELGLESPFDDSWFDRPWLDHRITTEIDVTPHADVRRRALLAHGTQVDPTSKFWFGLPDDEMAQLSSHEGYILARSFVGPASVASAPIEDDLLAGVRDAEGAAPWSRS